jgi:hypothetical protein
VSEHRPEEPAENERDDELLEEQEGKGYGEDEGEREQALDEFVDEQG